MAKSWKSDLIQQLRQTGNSYGACVTLMTWCCRTRAAQGTTCYTITFNVTAIINTSGTVQERYGFDSFGATRVMDAVSVPAEAHPTVGKPVTALTTGMPSQDCIM